MSFLSNIAPNDASLNLQYSLDPAEPEFVKPQELQLALPPELAAGLPPVDELYMSKSEVHKLLSSCTIFARGYCSPYEPYCCVGCEVL